MINFNQYLKEKRRNPDQNQKISAYDYLEKYKNDDNTYISFTLINKIGINPKSRWQTTPNGIYTYPLKQIWKVFDHKNRLVKSEGTELYGHDRKYIQVVQGTKKNFIEDISKTYSKSDLEKDFKKLADMYPDIFDIEEMRNETKRLSKMNSPGGILWEMVKYLASDGTGKANGAFPMKFNTIFRKLGYSGIADKSGKGIIHENEPVQAVFFSKQGFKHIKTLDRLPNSDDNIMNFDKKVERISNLLDYLDNSFHGEEGPRLMVNTNGSLKLSFDKIMKVNILPDEKMLKNIKVSDIKNIVDDYYGMDPLYDLLLSHEWLFVQVLKNYDKLGNSFAKKFTEHLCKDDVWIQNSLKSLNPIVYKFFKKYLKKSKLFNKYKKENTFNEIF